jgi:hypothetical protein
MMVKKTKSGTFLIYQKQLYFLFYYKLITYYIQICIYTYYIRSDNGEEDKVRYVSNLSKTIIFFVLLQVNHLLLKLRTSQAGSSQLTSQAYRAEPSRSSQSTRLGSFEPSFWQARTSQLTSYEPARELLRIFFF